MIQTLYRFIPLPLRTQVFQAVAERVKTEEEKHNLAFEKQLPHLELRAEHIRNLRILIDRNALLKVLPANAIVAEIGVAEGDFSEQILSIAKPKRLHLIDSWAHDDRYDNLRTCVEARFVTEINRGQISVHQGFSTAELQKFDDSYFDWVYLDASHNYSTTIQELEICRHKVKAGGMIAGHDYVTGYWPTKCRYGVIEAVHEFCLNYGWELLYLTHESHRHLSYAMRAMA